MVPTIQWLGIVPTIQWSGIPTTQRLGGSDDTMVEYSNDKMDIPTMRWFGSSDDTTVGYSDDTMVGAPTITIQWLRGSPTIQCFGKVCYCTVLSVLYPYLHHTPAFLVQD